MGLLPPTLTFPESDTYVKYWNYAQRNWQYLHLIERDLPLVYDKRIALVAPGSKSSLSIFDELDPSEDKHHVYKFYLGVYPETWVYLWHPYDVKQLMFDERVSQINDNAVAVIRYEESPADAPTKGIWVIHERYPGIEVRNVGRRTFTVGVRWLGAKYRVEFDDEISASAKNDLNEGKIPSLPIAIGGEW